MEISKTKKEKILRNAEILMLKTQLLIESCEDWLPAEEGNKNMEQKIRERKKTEKAQTPAAQSGIVGATSVRPLTINH